ncbi:MAG TPA: D-alanyl-D-alanine carboxypeptidase family protein [Gaiellaceae bacterium]|nr:D-alanyl-D-alanine carboxypeptidase family protein [Gaiellaceae bacterium]
MALDVLTPVPRRRRRRYRLRRLLPLAVVATAALVAGVLVGWRGAAAGHAHAAPPATSSHERRSAVSHPAAKTTPPARPLVLLHGPPLLAGELHARLESPEAILVDAKTGRVLWEKSAHQRRAIASTTKIMTALLALREVPWRQTITVSGSVSKVPLVREGLRGGEHVQTWKLFYSLLLYSGNDDANQLAITAAGSVPAFLVQMNEEARRLGMRDTHFTSPSGVVDQGNYSTAWDLAALTRYALRNLRFRKLVRTKRIEVPWAPPTNAKIYLNNNWLLHEYRGADGVKTGFTTKSGWCLVASATRRGRTLIAVVLDSGNIYADAKNLLNLGFSHA